MRIKFRASFQADASEIVECAFAPRGAADALAFEREFDISKRRAPGQEVVVLRHIPDPGVDVGDHATVVENSAVGRRHQPGEHVEDRGLSAA